MLKLIPFIYSLFCFFPAFGSDDFFTFFPQKSYTLSTGETIKLPTHFYQTDGYMLIGHADKDIISAVLAEEGLEPVITLGNRALVVFTFFITGQHTLGPHRDAAISIPIKKRDDLEETLPGPSTLSNMEMYSWLFYGKLPIAITADREVWGIDKKVGDLSRVIDGKLHKFSLSDGRGEILKIQYKDKFAVKVPLTMESTLVTPLILKQTRSNTFFRGKFKVRPFSNSHDQVSFNQGHPVGGMLGAIDFKPLFWQVGLSIKGAFNPPRSSVE